MIYLLIFLVLFGLELFYFKVADRFNIIDRPNERSSHTRITLRGGGVVFYMGALLYFILSKGNYPFFMLGLTLVGTVSFVDDIKSVSRKTRLLVQFAAMGLMFHELGLFTDFPLWYLLVALIFFTGITNAYNFMDGINGITGGYSLVVLGALYYINQTITPFTDPFFLITMILAVLVFNIFNFRVKAKCFAGDVGAVSLAFIILFFLGQLILKTGDLTYLILLVVYGVDSVLTIIHRLLLKENIFDAHRKHAYQLLANELNWKHPVVSLLYMAIQTMTLIGFFAASEEIRWLYFGLTLLFLSLSYIFFMKKYFKLHQQ